MGWFFDLMRPDEWSAVAAVVATIAGVIAATFAVLQLRDARRVRREQSAPYVVARLDHSEASHKLVDLVVKNYGTTTAYDIRLQVDPPMIRTTDHDQPDFAFMESKAIATGVAMLVPGQEIRIFFDSLPERAITSMPNQFQIRVRARDSRKRELEEGLFDVDASWNQDSLNVLVHSTHWIGARIQGIERALDRLVTAGVAGSRLKELPIDSEPLRRIAEALEVREPKTRRPEGYRRVTYRWVGKSGEKRRTDSSGQRAG
jgi:hypothetical protein